jgi:hypothetical protein
LFEEICKDVISNANFTRQQLNILKQYEDDLHKLEEQKAVLEAAGVILAEQKILPQKKTMSSMSFDDEDGTQMVSIDTGTGRKKRDQKKKTEPTEIDNELNSMMLESTLKVVAGICNEEDAFRLFKLTFRVSRGKVLVFTKSVGKIYTNMVDPTAETKPVAVYLMVFQNEEELMKRVERICDGFSKIKYDLETAFQPEERELKIKRLNELIAG